MKFQPKKLEKHNYNVPANLLHFSYDTHRELQNRLFPPTVRTMKVSNTTDAFRVFATIYIHFPHSTCIIRKHTNTQDGTNNSGGK